MEEQKLKRIIQMKLIRDVQEQTKICLHQRVCEKDVGLNRSCEIAFKGKFFTPHLWVVNLRVKESFQKPNPKR